MSDVLSQSEIDALLSAINGGDVDAEAARQTSAERTVKPFDFLRPNKFSRDQLRTIELLHDGFCRDAGTQLAGALRAPVEIEVLSADQVTYGEFINSLPVPTLVTVSTMEPLEGNVIVELNLPLAFSMIDRLVGGPGSGRPRFRELTEIEGALIAGTTNILLSAFSEAWSSVFEASFRAVATEMNPQSAQIVAPSEIVVLITFEMRVGDSRGMLSLCIPYLVIEPAVSKLSARSYFSGSSNANLAETRENIERELGRVRIPLSVVLGAAELSVEDLMSLAPGDVIPLGAAPGAEASVRIGSRAAFLAQPGTRGRRAAVQITREADDLHQGVEV